MLFFSSIIIGAALSVPPIPTISQTAILDAPSPTVSPTFGMLVAISGDRVVATGPDPSKDGGSVGQIATFEFQPTGEWKPFREMQSVDNTQRGLMVLQRMTMVGSVMLVSQDRRDGASSTVATFETAITNSGWKQSGLLEPPIGFPEPAFGGVIASDGVIAAISTVDMRVLGEKSRTVIPSPKVFLFKRGVDGWKGLGSLQLDLSLTPTFFGAAISMTSGQIVIGCPKAIVASPKQPLVVGGDSVVVVYRLNADGMWGIDGMLKPPQDRSDYLGFGTTVASSDSLIAVRFSQVTGQGSAVLVYRRDQTGWVFDGELNPLIDVTPGIGWGISLAIADDRIIVGDPTALISDKNPGYVGAFVKDSNGLWSESLRLQPNVPVTSARWGVGIRADGRRVVIARPQNEREGITPGGALLFTLPPADSTPRPSTSSTSSPASTKSLTAP
ncbi:MAG: hypothetical protein O2875_00975 [Planctomycetota bacterium]|nr:hypothetical protein [Planctomycetota bacterium]MDA1261504.1 hypothetical protein [Planctomycetota bacterium]